jgi:hypothetical protein
MTEQLAELKRAPIHGSGGYEYNVPSALVSVRAKDSKSCLIGKLGMTRPRM